MENDQLRAVKNVALTNATTWPSPAKINLFLHVTSQRNDGYHELQTVFQFLDYCDYLQFKVTRKPDISLLTPVAGVANSDNLIIRAATHLKRYVNSNQGVAVSIDKRLPIGGGLGSGSSNAATTLIALNRLWNCQLSDVELKQLGLSLGADIPIFIHGNAAWAEGVGDILTTISPPETWYIVIAPDCRVSTAKVFSSPELTRYCEPITISDFLSGEGRNVLEDIVRKYYQPVADALDWLGRYASSRMTGTGACVFASVNNKMQARKIMGKLPKNWQGFVAKGCNRSPLISQCLQN